MREAARACQGALAEGSQTYPAARLSERLGERAGHSWALRIDIARVKEPHASTRFLAALEELYSTTRPEVPDEFKRLFNVSQSRALAFFEAQELRESLGAGKPQRHRASRSI